MHGPRNGVRPRRRVLEKITRSARLAGAGVLVLACLAGSSWCGGWPAAAQLQSEPPRQAACLIKGNINDRGERIYHVPGGAFYDRTRISPSKGERWFCTEAEARQAGWRRSRR